MRRITITPEIEKLADGYKKGMLYKRPHKGLVSIACKNLSQVRERIVNGSYLPQNKGLRYTKYLDKIMCEYEYLLTMHPNSFCGKASEFDKIIKKEDLSSEISIKVDKKGKPLKKTYNRKFFELIVWALRYDYVQGKVFPDIIRNLGIRTCVYCNAQYAISTRNKEAFYQLDHCYPKSIFPYLATSFYNLQPSCSSCNQRKADMDMRKGIYDVSIWKESDDRNDRYFDFHIEDGSLSQYMTSHDRKVLELDIVNVINGVADLDDLLNLCKERFKTKEIYQEHREEAEELIWKKYSYTPSYVESIRKAFNNVFSDKSNQLKRILLGTYTKPEDVFKRPLTKMLQDVAKQLNMDMLLDT